MKHDIARGVRFESLEGRLLLDASLYGGLWRIDGDADPAAPDDRIEVAPSEADPTQLEAFLNGESVGTAPLSKVRAIRIRAGEGNDVVLVDLPADAGNVRVIVYGGPGDDELHGGPGNDRLLGQDGADVLWGGEGRDVLIGGDGDDELHGGADRDRLFGHRGDDVLFGDDGDDVLYGNRGADELHGGDGADRLFGGWDADVLRGDAGDDRLFAGPGNDLLAGGDGADRLYGGGGDDELLGGDGDDRLYGSYGADVLAGGEGNDRLYGGPAADALDGDAGDDWLYGGYGADRIQPGDGTDRIVGGPGRNVLYGKPGDDVRAARRDIRMGDLAESRLEAFASADAFRQRLVDVALRKYDHLLGQVVPEWSWWDWPYYRILDVGDGLFTVNSVAEFGGVTAAMPDAADHSDTNNQVEGVEEADLVKTDGEFIYMILGQELVILDALPAEDIHVVSRTPIQGTPEGLFLWADRLVVLSATYPMWAILDGPVFADRVVGVPGWVGPEPAPYRDEVTVSLFDVTDRAAPELVQQTTMQGMLVDARAVDEQLFLVLGSDLWIPMPAYERREIVATDPPVLPKEPYDVTLVFEGSELAYMPRLPDWQPKYERVYETADEYAARLMQLPLEEVLPTYSIDGGAARLLSSPDDIFLPTDSLSEDLLTVVRMDMSAAGGDEPETTSLQGSGGHVYASRESLYVASRPEWTWPVQADTDRNTTRIYKFDLTQADMPLAATGVVAGTVHNQFSMDEYEGTFRVATTTFDRTFSNNLFVLRQDGGDLVAAGALTGIARTEQIYSVRYLGETAYMVTFRQVDPLFAIDLSDPTAPTVVGELHVPGFSRYLHPIDDSLLIGLGRDADADGRTRGLKLSLFDVSNPRRPQEVDVQLVGSAGPWGTTTEAEWDHHAFAYFGDYQTLCLPVYDYYAANRNTLAAYYVDEGGFVELGSIAGSGRMRRSLRIGDNVYAVSTGSVTVADLFDVTHVVGSVEL